MQRNIVTGMGDIASIVGPSKFMFHSKLADFQLTSELEKDHAVFTKEIPLWFENPGDYCFAVRCTLRRLYESASDGDIDQVLSDESKASITYFATIFFYL